MLYKINLEKAIESQKNAISNLIKNSGLTENQIKDGFKLCEMEDVVYEVHTGEQHKRKQIFDGMASLLGYNVEDCILIEREKRILDALEEIEESDGFVIEEDGCGKFENVYYAFYKDHFSVNAYKWKSVDRSIKDLDFEDVPDYIRNHEGVKKLIESL